MKTKLLTLLALLCITLSFSQTTFTVDGLNYEVTSTNPNEVSVTGVTPSILDLVIPETVIDVATGISYNVTAIGEEAFLFNSLTSVTIGENVVSIGAFAFESSGLTSVTIGENVVSIGFSAFRFNLLTSITIPNSVTTIGDDTFRDNTLTSVTIGENVVSIGASAFEDNDALTTVTSLSTNPATLPSDAFDGEGDNSAIDLTIPSGTSGAYIDANWLGFNTYNNTDLTFTVGDIAYIILDIINNDEVSAVGYIGTATVVNIPDTVTDSGTIYNVTAIGVGAFEENSLTSVTIGNNVTAIGEEAFIGNALTSVTISNNVTTIGERAFRNNAITSVTIPNSVTTIAQGTFALNSLTSITIPNSVTTIGFGAFFSNALTSVTIGENVASIGDLAFSFNSVLTTVTSLSTNPAILPSKAFDNDEDNSAIDLVFPIGFEQAYLDANWLGFNSYNNIGLTFTVDGLDYEVTSTNPNEVSLTGGTPSSLDLVIPETVTDSGIIYNVTAIGEEAFIGNALTSVTIPNSVTTIGERAFRDNQLTSVTIPNSVTTIAQGAFASNSLTSITIPNSVTTVGLGAFNGSSLTSVTIGENVASIGDLAFSFNSVLTTVISLSTNPAILPSKAFDNDEDNSAIDLTIPSGTAQAYADATWTGFKSVTEVNFEEIIIAPKVFLQGAATNPNTGEETLMRDDLRVSDLLPTISPYTDALTVDETVFSVEGNDAIVDWVFVELRDATDNSVIVASTSALLQRDGDVVDIDGISTLSFNALADNYFVVIKHRNHLGIMTANTVTLSGTTTTVDFTDANNPITFGTNAQTTFGMPAGILGMWAGNINGDGVVQFSGATPDASGILANVLNDTGNFLNFSTFVINGYTTNDIDINGAAQYEGGSADAPLILQNVLAHPSNFLNFSTFEILEQLPVNITNMNKQSLFINKVKTQIKF
ncbi:leucine-rich repeat domain-containing protein [Winogradskyella psychrotolerans]|uniref:leucine-rich repeat domain-containing protein n=1 Tax=Winogradskyella psychrotolerans TaxID=1344585 RepID=UPI001C06F5F4|nr:leucine-rich repeat domain-containing protein [Winogradskyella psychrotolerans]MBU2929106.1 leucine-rich repeat domain-containing protein [Winogradskyella psychrotolerans]